MKITIKIIWQDIFWLISNLTLNSQPMLEHVYFNSYFKPPTFRSEFKFNGDRGLNLCSHLCWHNFYYYHCYFCTKLQHFSTKNTNTMIVRKIMCTTMTIIIQAWTLHKPLLEHLCELYLCKLHVKLVDMCSSC